MQTTIQVVLHDKESFKITLESYDSIHITELLNDNTLTVINLGGLVVNRNSIRFISPISTEPTG
jgi:hypothetical protein